MTSTPIATAWIQYVQPKRERCLRLFCLPYAGGSASIFRGWSDILPPQIEVCPIQLPGRESRLSEEPFSDMEVLVDALGRALQPYLNMPYVLFGHSMGAFIALELAHYLRREYGLNPFHLFVSGCRAPQLPARNLPVHQLSHAELLEKLRHLKGTPEDILQNRELLNLLLPALRADFAICDTYKYTSEELLTCPISAFGGLQDSDVPRDDLAGWREQTCSAFKLRFFPGNHFFLNTSRLALLQMLVLDLLPFLR